MNRIYKMKKRYLLPFALSMVAVLFFHSQRSYGQLTSACNPSYTGSDGAHNIGSATIGTLNLSSISYSTHDYTAQSFSANAGDSVSLSLLSNGWCAVAVAADWNNDGDFDDPNEILAMPNYIGNSAATYNFKVIVPPTVVTGSYRFRLWNIGANSGAGTPAGSPCGAYTWGSWLDVKINVTNNHGCLPPAVATVSGIMPTTAQLSWIPSTSTPAGYIWKIVNQGDAPTVAGVASGTATDTFASVTGLTSATSYQLYLQSDCTTDSSLWSLPVNFQTLCDGQPNIDSLTTDHTNVCASTQVHLKLRGATAHVSGISYHWQSATAANGPWTDLTGTDTTLTVTGQTAATYYRGYITCSGSGLADTTTALLISQYAPNQCYCTPPANQYGSSYNVNSFSTTNGASNITNNNSGSSAGNYGDFTSMSVSALQTVGTVNFSVATASGAGIRIWVDWNQDGDFDDVGEQVYVNSSSNSSFSGTIAVPASAAVGNTRLRIRSNAYYYINSQSSPCNKNYYGETEDYTFNVIPATGCIIPLNLAVSNITNTMATIRWVSPPVGSTPAGFEYEIRSSGLAGSGATGLAASGSITDTFVNLTGLLPNVTYTAYVRTNCGGGAHSDWVNSNAFATPLYEPVAIIGLNEDVIANGSGPSNQATLSTNAVVDGPATTGYVYISSDFNNGTGTFSDGLPMDRKLISGTKYWKLADYNGNNTLKMKAQSATDTIRFATPRSAKNVSVLDASAYGSSAFFNVLFSDGTSYVTDTVSVANWYGGTPVASHSRRINRGNSGETPSNGSTGPNMYETLIAIPNADTNKVITAIVVTKTTDSNNFLHVFAVSINPSLAACAIPTALAAQNVSSTGADISWVGSASKYQLSYGVGLTNPESGTTIDTITMNSISLAGLLQSASSYNVYVRSICGASDTSFWAGPISIATPCDGTPEAGSVTSDMSSVCPLSTFTLTVGGASPMVTGISYHWQSADSANGPWTDLTGADTVLSVTGQTAATYYRAYTVCSGSGLGDTTNALLIAQNPPTDCYCVPSTSGGTNYNISNFTTTNGLININHSSSGSSSGYQDFHTTDSVAVVQGFAFNYSIAIAGGSTYGKAIWIDYNEDGVFEASEQVASSNGYVGSPISGTITVPDTITPGSKRMRIVATYSPNNPSNPCSNSGTGEYEDYTVNVIALTPCAGTPVPGNTIANDSSFCVSGTATLALENNYMTSSGIMYQWQQNTTGSWDDIAGDTLMTTNSGTLTATTQFRCRLICANGGDTAYSNPVTIAIHPLPIVTVSPQTATFCSSSPVTLTAAGAMTYVWTPTDSLNVDTGVTVQASPSALTQYTVTGTDIHGCSASATASVGPISAIKLDAAVSYSDACTGGNPITISVSPVSVNSGTIEYQFTDSLGNVLQAWNTDTAYTETPASDGVYKYKVYAKISGCADSTWIPGLVTAYVGFTGNVTVEDADCSGNPGSITVSSATGPGAAGEVVWYQNDFSSANLNTSEADKFGNATITGGYLSLTEAINSQYGGFEVKNPNGYNVKDLHVAFDIYVNKSNGADGMSYNFGDDATFVSGTKPEAGITSKLAVCFQSYTNPGVYVIYGKPQSDNNNLSQNGQYVLASSTNTSWKSGTKKVIVDVDNAGKLTLSIGGTVIFNQIQLPAAYVNADKSNWQHLFEARTGGVNENHRIDNLEISGNASRLYFGLSAGGSGQIPSTWQGSGSFAGLSAGDSFDVWMANPADSLNCNKSLGTYFIGAPTLIAPAPQYTTGQQNCGVDDAVLTVQVDSAGTYGVRYHLNGDTSFLWQNNIATINDGTADFIIVQNLVPGVYTDVTAFKGADTCFSNTLAGPFTLAPVVSGIAMSSSVDSMQQGSGLTLTYRNSSCEQIAMVSSNANLGKVNAHVVVDTVLYDAAGAPYSGRYYVITPSQNSSQSASLTLYFSNADINAYNAAVAALGNPSYPAMDTAGANILISAYHGTSSAGITGPGSMFDSASSDLITPSSIVDKGNYVAVTFTSANGFSGFFAHTLSNTPLALTFGNISADNAGEKNVVQWNTLNEEAGNYFIVERSEDGRSFRQIGKVAGKGMAADYAFDDVQPATGVNYYRVAMVALNGHTIYSRVVSAGMDMTRFNVAVYPNPVSDVLTVKVSGGNLEGATIEVRDVTGRLLKQIKVKNVQTQISMAGLAQGVYILKYQENNQERVFKVNKQ